MGYGTGIIKNKSAKGDYAEELVSDYFTSRKYEIFSPSGERAHLFDGFAIRKNQSDIKTFMFDVKSKAARNYFKDTGIDYKHFQHYKLMSEFFSKKFLLFFVDEELGKIYYQNLNHYFSDTGLYKFYMDEDENRYPKIEWKKVGDEKYIYFSLETMVLLRDLTEEEITKLKSFKTGKNFDFNPTWDINSVLKKDE